MLPTTSFAFRRIPATAGAALTLAVASAAALAAVVTLAWPAPADAKVEWIGRINGENVYLIWGGECSALDPPNDNVVSVTITYTGPPQPGVFSDVVLYPPFDTYTTDGTTFLSVVATGAPMPLPCPTCFRHAFAHTTSVDPEVIVNPFTFVEYNSIGDSCEGTVFQSEAAGIPAMGRWATAALIGAVLAVGVMGLRATPGEIG